MPKHKFSVWSSCLCQVRVQCDIGGWGHVVCSFGNITRGVPEAWSAQTQHGARVVSAILIKEYKRFKDDDVTV